MKDEEVIDIVQNAVDFVESKNLSDAKLRKERIKLALWLADRFNIALKEVLVSKEDGKAYIVAHYMGEDLKEKEVHVCIDKWEKRFLGEMKKAAGVSDA